MALLGVKTKRVEENGLHASSYTENIFTVTPLKKGA
jgi:hypothetical protein